MIIFQILLVIDWAIFQAITPYWLFTETYDHSLVVEYILADLTEFVHFSYYQWALWKW